MKQRRSKLGWSFAGLYLAVATFLILTQVLFGESFIAVVLGLPWSLIIVLIGRRYFPPQKSILHVLVVYGYVLFPIVLNAVLLYLIGFGLDNLVKYLAARAYRKDTS